MQIFLGGQRRQAALETHPAVDNRKITMNSKLLMVMGRSLPESKGVCAAWEGVFGLSGKTS